MNKLLDINQAAERLAISVSTLYKGQASTADLRRVRMGKKLCFLERDIEEFIKAKLKESDRAQTTKVELYKKRIPKSAFAIVRERR